jgi:Second Messenger Oligonucleotide or Dinucleotide Synthetase domain
VPTVNTAFEAFRCKLELTSMQESLVATRQARVRTSVERGLMVNESFLTGSYRRHTLIAPMRTADIDIVMVLDHSYHRQGPRAALDLVKDTLRETYQTSRISRNGQAAMALS